MQQGRGVEEGESGVVFFFCFSVELKGEINEQHVC